MTAGERHNEWLNMEHYSDTPLFNTKAVVQQTGIAAVTLHAWERRYTILSPRRANNDYRLYSERDIMTIRWLKERIDEGMTISQAIALFRHRNAKPHVRAEQEAIPEPTPAFHIALPALMPQEHVVSNEENEAPASQDVQEQLAINDLLHVSREPLPDNYLVVYSMQTARENLLEAFKALDETSANILMAAMLAIYTVEQVCMELVVPTLWQIGQLWQEGKITVCVEHFATTFLRSLLSNLLHATANPPSAPLIIPCCAPEEPHEVAPLMLALFLRRAGMRVVYLGQSIEMDGLLHTIQQQAPALICVSLTLRNYLTGLVELGRRIQDLPAPRPLFAFGGQVFVHSTHLIAQVPGIYLNGDLRAGVAKLQHMLAARNESNEKI
jgi:MerR family transcriptional regulator, light-induced transcriptional regulator